MITHKQVEELLQFVGLSGEYLPARSNGKNFTYLIGGLELIVANMTSEPRRFIKIEDEEASWDAPALVCFEGEHRLTSAIQWIIAHQEQK